MSGVLNLVTGPSGAGKSEFARRQSDWTHRLYNLDDWARVQGNTGDHRVRERGWKVIVAALCTDMEQGRTPIARDHVLDSRALADMVEPARKSGYQTRLYVVCPGDAEVCVWRVLSRRSEGGHGKSEGTVRQLYEDAMLVASEASLLCDETMFIHSGGADLETVAVMRDFVIVPVVNDLPEWLLTYFSPSTANLDDRDMVPEPY